MIWKSWGKSKTLFFKRIKSLNNKNIFKCFKYCGCGFGGKCMYCNSKNFTGYYDSSGQFHSPLTSVFNTDGSNCTTDSDVIFKKLKSTAFKVKIQLFSHGMAWAKIFYIGLVSVGFRKFDMTTLKKSFFSLNLLFLTTTTPNFRKNHFILSI